MRHTQGQYLSLQHAYDWFNRSLFDNELPQVLITLQRSKVALGYFWCNQYSNRDGSPERLDEIALNPEAMHDRSDEQILSTLVHEMVHCWQQHYGHPSRSGYHNAQWASVMVSVGLIPSDTGEPGGKQVGQQMTHYVDEHGYFRSACNRWLKRNPKGIQWEVTPLVKAGGEGGDDDPDEGKAKTRTQKRASKTKYTCPACGQNAWAKKGASLLCGKHTVEDLTISEKTMRAEEKE